MNLITRVREGGEKSVHGFARVRGSGGERTSSGGIVEIGVVMRLQALFLLGALLLKSRRERLTRHSYTNAHKRATNSILLRVVFQGTRAANLYNAKKVKNRKMRKSAFYNLYKISRHMTDHNAQPLPQRLLIQCPCIYNAIRSVGGTDGYAMRTHAIAVQKMNLCNLLTCHRKLATVFSSLRHLHLFLRFTVSYADSPPFSSQ